MIWTALRSGKRLVAAVAAIVTLGAVFAWRALHLTDLAHIGAGYAAEQTCSCLFVSGRALPSCRTDLEPLARWVISLKPGADSVAARAFGFATATARYERNFGCTLED